MNPEDKRLAREALVRNKLTVDQVSEIQTECDATARSFTEVAIGRGWLRLADVKALTASPAPVKAPSPSPEKGPGSASLRPAEAARAPAAPAPPERLRRREGAQAGSHRPSGAESAPPSAKAAVSPLFPILIAAALVILIALLVTTLVSLLERSRREREQAVESAKMVADAERKSAQARQDYQRRTLEERDTRARAALEKARAALKRAEDPRAERTFDDPLVEATLNYDTYLDINPNDAAVLVERSRVHAHRRTYPKAVDDLERAVALDPTLEPKVRENLRMLRMMLPKK